LLTRGYGKDEDSVISSKLADVAVISGRKRASNALAFLEKQDADIFIMDDGFQHFKVKRDIDIVTINARMPFGNGFVLPSGILREPLTALERAHIVVITKSDLVAESDLAAITEQVKAISADAEIFYAVHAPRFFYTPGGRQPLEYIKGKRIICVSGLGDNGAFSKTLEVLGAEICRHIHYMDHHRYSIQDLAHIHRTLQDLNADLIVTTEKDWIKLKSIDDKDEKKKQNFLILKVELEVKEHEIFYNRLRALLPG